MSENEERFWDVEVYVGSTYVTTITVKAKTPDEASTLATEKFNVKVKKHYASR